MLTIFYTCYLLLFYFIITFIYFITFYTSYLLTFFTVIICLIFSISLPLHSDAVRQSIVEKNLSDNVHSHQQLSDLKLLDVSEKQYVQKKEIDYDQISCIQQQKNLNSAATAETIVFMCLPCNMMFDSDVALSLHKIVSCPHSNKVDNFDVTNYALPPVVEESMSLLDLKYKIRAKYEIHMAHSAVGDAPETKRTHRTRFYMSKCLTLLYLDWIHWEQRIAWMEIKDCAVV